jgi:hypothetical protein
MASSPPSFSSFLDPHSHFLNPCGCSWLDVIAGNRPCEQERPAGASRSGRARHGRPWQASTASLVMTVSAIPSARMGISLSRSMPLDLVALYLFVVHREHWPRRSALCAAAARCMWTGLSVVPPSLLSTSSSLSSLTDPFPSLSCRSGSPEMTGARQPTSAVRHERRRGSSGAVELWKERFLDLGWHGEHARASISVGRVTGGEIRRSELLPCLLSLKSGTSLSAHARGRELEQAACVGPRRRVGLAQ